MQAAFWVTHQSPLKLELLELRTRSCSWVSTLTFSVYSSEVCIEYTGCALRQQSLPAASVKRTPGKQCFSIMSDVLWSLFHHFSLRTLKSSLRRKVFLEEVVLHGSSLKSLTPQNGSLSTSVTTLHLNQLSCLQNGDQILPCEAFHNSIMLSSGLIMLGADENA